MKADMHSLAKLDLQYVWHPFTQMKEWLQQEPLVIQSGRGAILKDVYGRKYLDGNSSIWTNLHGHSHPAINKAIHTQLRKIAHSSALGLANEPASLLAARLIAMARSPDRLRLGRSLSKRLESHADGSGSLPGDSELRNPQSEKVFFSDDGSTAMEVALKLAFEYARRTGLSRRPKFLSLNNSYHGDTIGAVSLGHVDLFHKAYGQLLFKSDQVQAPYCYRCRFNRARPERADARTYRRCQWECVAKVESKFAQQKRRTGETYAAMVVEPVIQGVAGMVVHPEGWLRRVTSIVRSHGSQLIADEVMTGFGRTGPLLASHREGVQPDFIALAKGMTGGYLPMAATLTTGAVFDAFLGDYSDFKTFFHGHSYTSNQVGAAASLASLDLLEAPGASARRAQLARTFAGMLQRLWALPQVGDVRHVGCIAGVELVADWKTRWPYDLRLKVGIRVCAEMARLGVLTRPIGNVIVLMPPYCVTERQLDQIVTALERAIQSVLA